MKIKVLATGQGPDHYEFDGDKITAHQGELSEMIDLTELEHGDKFEGAEPEALTLPGSQIIRDAYRDSEGVLHVTLCEASPMMGNWTDSGWIAAEAYKAGKQNIRRVVDGAPLPSQAMTEVDDEAQD